MKRILSFLKKDAVLTAAWTLAILSMAAVPPSIRYISYLDLHTLGLLFCLMATMAGLQAMGFFHQMGESLLMRIHSLRQLEMLLVLLCFFSSMFITNDVALITFVPFAIELLKMIRREDRLIPVVVLQTIPANLGSMATPTGNPQNLYLYSHYHLGMGAFLRIMLPFALLSLLLILLALLRGKNQPLSFGLSEMQTVSGAAPFCRKSLLSYLSGSRRKMDPHPIPSAGGRLPRTFRRQRHIFKGRLLPSDHLCGLFHFHWEHETDPLDQQSVPAADHRQ